MMNVEGVNELDMNIQTTAMKKFNNIEKPLTSTPLTPHLYRWMDLVIHSAASVIYGISHSAPTPYATVMSTN